MSRRKPEKEVEVGRKKPEKEVGAEKDKTETEVDWKKQKRNFPFSIFGKDRSLKNSNSGK
jgi:hypothetical protein